MASWRVLRRGRAIGSPSRSRQRIPRSVIAYWVDEECLCARRMCAWCACAWRVCAWRVCSRVCLCVCTRVSLCLHTRICVLTRICTSDVPLSSPFSLSSVFALRFTLPHPSGHDRVHFRRRFRDWYLSGPFLCGRRGIQRGDASFPRHGERRSERCERGGAAARAPARSYPGFDQRDGTGTLRWAGRPPDVLDKQVVDSV